jgi:uncharacterized protein YqgC (DUF456 family)
VTLTEAVVGLAILVGLLGIIVPILPGGILIFTAVLVWAGVTGGATAWVVFAVVAAFLVVGTVVKYAVPGRRLKDAGIPASTQWIGVAVGVAGFFVIPVIGLFVGFILGIYLAERTRLGAAQAWPSTKQALRAVGLSIVIELTAAILATVTWIVGLAVT